METKFCKHCQCEHPLTKKFWYIALQVRCKIQAKGFYVKKKDLILREKASYYETNKDSILLKKREHYKQNADAIKERQKTRRTKDVINTSMSQKRNYERHKKQRVLWQVDYCKKRMANDVKFRLARLLRDRLRKSLKGNQKAGSAVRDLGCTVYELKQHLESKFQEGMTWENHGLYGWHIDHIMPLASFDLTDREQFLKACHYTNLQPLWAKDNLQKSGKI